jgi:hypothetical protein
MHEVETVFLLTAAVTALVLLSRRLRQAYPTRLGSRQGRQTK